MKENYALRWEVATVSGPLSGRPRRLADPSLGDRGPSVPRVPTPRRLTSRHGSPPGLDPGPTPYHETPTNRYRRGRSLLRRGTSGGGRGLRGPTSSDTGPAELLLSTGAHYVTPRCGGPTQTGRVHNPADISDRGLLVSRGFGRTRQWFLLCASGLRRRPTCNGGLGTGGCWTLVPDEMSVPETSTLINSTLVRPQE